MQEYLITTREVSGLSRSMSLHIDEEKINSYIRESENIDIRSAIGDALYLDIKKNRERYELLLEGGTYKDKKGDERVLTGLKPALAYYAYARLLMNSDGSVTRYGFVNKDSEYSGRPEFKEKVQAYNNACAVADRYLKETVLYLKENNEQYPLYRNAGEIKANRTTYRIIGE